jgi:threonine synthase
VISDQSKVNWWLITVNRKLLMIQCSACQQSYPEDQIPYRCPSCGSVFDLVCNPDFSLDQMDPSQPGIWRYRHTFCLPDIAPVISLGEGNTPLVWSEAFGQQVAFKLEFLNPTGSFKDRGTTPLVSFLRARGVTAAVEDSSGNAGASFAAYAAAAGIDARVFVPAYASGPKRAQIEAYGAEVVNVPGPRSKAAEAVEQAAKAGAVYASHVYMPQGIMGYATIAYELWFQLGEVPGTVIVPAGQGSLLLGIDRGFETLQRAGLIDRKPALVGVQAVACAPLWAAFNQGPKGLHQILEKETLAEGVRTRYPIRWKTVVQLVKSSTGHFLVVDEDEILQGQNELAQRGLFVEPTSAIVWDAFQQIVERTPSPVVIILTGSGLKAVS